MNSAPSNVMLS